MTGKVAAMSYVCRSCGCNAHNAMCNRHGAKAPEVTRDFDWFVGKYRQIEPQIASLYQEHLLEHEAEWEDRWSEGKLRAIRASVADDTPAPHKVKCMVKRESGHKRPTKARCIQFYPNLSTQEMFARETASLQKAWTKFAYRGQIDGDNPGMRLTFSSGLNAAKLGEWATEVLKDYSKPKFYERDGKNWDATMGKEHFELRYKLYEVAGPAYVDFAKKCAKVRGFGVFKEQVLRYSLDYTTKSGHNDTTLGNNLVNAAITCTAFRGRKCDILIAGDDLLVIVEGDIDGEEIAKVEMEMGIKPEWRVFDSIEDSSYISGLFAITDEGVKFIARPGRLLACLFWSVKPPSLKKLIPYQRGVAKGVLPTMQCVPVVGQWLKSIAESGSEIIADRSRRVYTYGAEVKADFKPWFARRYELSDAQIEEAVSILTHEPHAVGFVNSYAIERILERDLADIEDREESGETTPVMF